MRVPNIIMYDTSTYQLNRITNDLNSANEVISTQKRINAASDDPIGLSQVLGLRLSIENLTQLEKNVDMGISWLSGSETALRSVSDQLIDAKLLVTQMANDSVSAKERSDAVETVDGIIRQLVSLGNTQVNGNYIFSGIKTDTRAFTFDDDVNPTTVEYQGNAKAFAIKTTETTTLEVGRDGGALFAEKTIVVNGTNNKIIFEEDPGLGENSKRVLEGVVPDGEYTREQLSVVVRNAMNQASKDFGYGVTYQVEYDSTAKKYTIVDDGKYNGYMGIDLLWESGETPRVGGINTNGVLLEGVDINLVNENALIHNTPQPDGTAPLRLTWDGTSKWSILNDPGYGLPLSVSGTDAKVELDLTGDGLADIVVTMDSPAENGGYIEFDITSASNERSIGADMGFVSGDSSVKPASSTNTVTLKTFDNTNNVIDFQEIMAGPVASGQLTAAIPEGDYDDMDTLASAIEQAMEDASLNNVDYDVTYNDVTYKFTITDTNSALSELQLLWNSGTNTALTAASELGHAVADDTGTTTYTSDGTVSLFTITLGSNDTINFKELLKGQDAEDTSELTATIPAGSYLSPEALARAIEDALEDASEQYGNRVNYQVTYNSGSRKFTIKEDGVAGKKLESVELLFGTGTDVDQSAAGTLGFENINVATPPAVSDEVKWGIFETLFDLKDYLATNDIDGINRTLTRIDTHYNSITSVLSDIGIKYNRLETRKQVSAESKLAITERKSMIEDADIVEAIMNLKSIQTAYEASLNSTSKLLNISLVDFL